MIACSCLHRALSRNATRSPKWVRSLVSDSVSKTPVTFAIYTLKIILPTHFGRLCRYYFVSQITKCHKCHIITNLMKTRRYAKKIGDASGLPLHGSTLNPGHSCLFTWVRFLTPILTTVVYCLSRCLAKTTTELATTSMCKHKPKTLFSGFADLQAFCGMFAGRFGRLFLFLAYSVQKCFEQKNNRRGCGVRPAYPTPMHYSGLKNCYLHARERGGKYDETFKIIKFPWFLSVSVFWWRSQQKLGGSDHNW